MHIPHRSVDESDGAAVIAQPNHVLLKHTRGKLGMSLQQVADACGVNVRQYQKFESGERDIAGCSFALGLRICRTLKLDPWLFLPAVPASRSARDCSGAHASRYAYELSEHRAGTLSAAAATQDSISAIQDATSATQGGEVAD